MIDLADIRNFTGLRHEMFGSPVLRITALAATKTASAVYPLPAAS